MLGSGAYILTGTFPSEIVVLIFDYFEGLM